MQRFINRISPLRFGPILLIATIAAGCGDAGPAGDSPAVAAAPAPCATCKIIEVEMYTSGDGNYFEPANIQAEQGDMIRFKLMSGVHNVSFPADSNPGRSGLPGIGPILQLPGQTYDVALNMGTGRFSFWCDPHALIGMVGTIEVSPRN